jgi:hypothetical protein
MAVPNVVVNTTFSNKALTTAVSVYTFTATATGTYRIQTRLDAVAGGGDYIAYLTLNAGGVLTVDPMLPKTTLTAAAGETAFWFPTISIDLIVNDVLDVWVKSYTTETGKSGKIRIFSDAALDVTVIPANGSGFTSIPNSAGVTTILADYARRTGDYSVLNASGVRSAIGLASANLDTQLAALGVPSAGAITFPYTLTEADGTPIAGATVWATTDSAGLDVVESRTTDSFGVATFHLDAGTYYFWRQLAGYNFTDPDVEVVS